MPEIKMHADEFEINDGLLKRLLSEQFPRWAKLPVKRINSSGTDNAIFLLGSDLCVRMPRVEGADKNIEQEHLWLPKLSPKLTLPIPSPIAQGKPSGDYPWHWSVCPWLVGEDAFVNPITDRASCAQSLAEFLLSLENVDATGGPVSRRASDLSTQHEEVQIAFASMPTPIDKKFTAIWNECLKTPAWDKSPVWTHGDLLPTNLLVNNDRLSAVIDFDLMGVGDPACDMIAAWSVLCTDSRSIFKKALNVDDATWMRGIGWALSIALIIIPYYQNTNKTLVAIAHRMLNEILTDWKG